MGPVELGFVVGGIGAAGSLIGAGVTWGVLRSTVKSHEQRIAKIEAICEKQRDNCPTNLDAKLAPLYEKINRAAQDIAYIRGRYEKEEKEHGNEASY